MTVRQRCEHWLQTHVEGACRERTRLQYESALKNHVYPVIGDELLADLSRSTLKEFFGAKKGGLARNTVRNIAVPLSAMLNDAVDDGIIVANPADETSGPPAGRTEQEADNPDHRGFRRPHSLRREPRRR